MGAGMRKRNKFLSGSYPVLFTFVSMPHRADSLGISQDGTRYVIDTISAKLELYSVSEDIKIPTGKTARSILAYLSSKIIRGQFYSYLNKIYRKLELRGINYNRSDEYYRLIYNISQYTFYLPSITDIVKELFGYKSSKSVKNCYDIINGILRMGMSVTFDPRLKNIDVPNGRQFVIADEVNLVYGPKKSKNYIRFTPEGIKFFLNAVSIDFNTFVELDSVEQDLLTILIRKTNNPEMILAFSRARLEMREAEHRYLKPANQNPLKYADICEDILKKIRKTIDYSSLVLQIFNINKTHEHYYRYKAKIITAIENLKKIYYDKEFSFCIMPIENGVSYYGTDNLIGDKDEGKN